MKIILESNGETLELSDEEYDVLGFVDITIKSEIFDIHISELYPAVKSFYDKYKSDLKIDKLR